MWRRQGGGRRSAKPARGPMERAGFIGAARCRATPRRGGAHSVLRRYLPLRGPSTSGIVSGVRMAAAAIRTRAPPLTGKQVPPPTTAAALLRRRLQIHEPSVFLGSPPTPVVRAVGRHAGAVGIVALDQVAAPPLLPTHSSLVTVTAAAAPLVWARGRLGGDMPARLSAPRSPVTSIMTNIGR